MIPQRARQRQIARETEELVRSVEETLQTVWHSINQNPNSYTDSGRTIVSAGALTSTQQQAIFRYVSRMEDAIGINEVLRGIRSDSDLASCATTIIQAINDHGLVTEDTQYLYRKVSGPYKGNQQGTITSATDTQDITQKWGGKHTYRIRVPAGQRYILVRHTLVEGNFNEYLLGPGYFTGEVFPNRFSSYILDENVTYASTATGLRLALSKKH
jgi:hypothetical protein